MTKPQHEQDYETVRSELESLGKSREDCCDPCHYRCIGHAALESLARLRDEAAKVPGLEADNAALREQSTKVLYVAIGLHALYRSDSRVESDGSHEALFAETHRLLSGAHPGAALLERLAKAESERDAARTEVDAWKDASGLERGGSPEHVGPDHLRADLKKRDDEAWALRRLAEQRLAERNSTESEAEALRERVATLESLAYLGDHHFPDLTWKARCEETVTDLRAAEARVKELEARLKDAAQVELSLRNTLAGSLASQPPPAPAQGVKCRQCKGSGTDVDTDEEGGTQNERHVPCSRCKGSGQAPTPTPPALVEAVGYALESLTAAGSHPNVVARLRAAYDAAKGGASTASALDREQMTKVVELAHQHGWNGVSNAKHLATFLTDMMEDAAKYRAAVAAVPSARAWARADYGTTGLSLADTVLGKLGLTLDSNGGGK